MRYFLFIFCFVFIALFGSSVFAQTPSVSIITPEAGSTFTPGSPVSISWEVSDLPEGATVRSLVRIPTRGTGYLNRIVSGTSYDWTIPSAFSPRVYTVEVRVLVRSRGFQRIYTASRDIAVVRVTSTGGGGGGGSTPVSLDVQLAGQPSSQTVVRAAQNVPFLGFTLSAPSGDVRIASLRVQGVAVSGVLNFMEVQGFALYDGNTRVSDVKSLGHNLNVLFSNLNLTIRAGQIKTLVLKGNISANAGGGDVYAFYIDGANSSNIVAADAQGKPVAVTGVAANADRLISTMIAEVGDVTVAKAADDVESAAGIIIAGREEVLAKFRFAATNEEMIVNKMQILITNQGSATAFTGAAVDEVRSVKLYDGATQIGSLVGYPVTSSGASSGVAFVESLNWKIPKDGNKTLTVKGVLNTVVGGADSGASVYAVLLNTGFEAQGATAKDTTTQSVVGNQKILYKTKPIVTLPTQPGNKLTPGEVPVFRFRIAADRAYDVSWKKITLKVSVIGATMVALDPVPGTMGNVKVRDLTVTNSNLNIANTSGGPISGGASGFVPIVLATEQEIPAGAYKDYEVSLPFTNLSSLVGVSYASVQLALQETQELGGVAFSVVQASDASFIWSDNSVSTHSEASPDWANGRYVQGLPTDQKSVTSQADFSFGDERVVFVPVPVIKQSQNTGFASILKSIFWVIGG